MDRLAQLRDRDVRNDAPALDPVSFLDEYMKSNFPQTIAYPSPEQKQQRQSALNEENQLNFKQVKSPSTGTSYDRPQVS